MPGIRKLSDVLSEVGQLPWNHALYLPFDNKWDLDTRCAVLDPDDCEPDEDGPRFATQHGLGYVLTVQQIQDIRTNAAVQRPELSDEGLFAAFLHYYDNDAFIKF